MSLCLVRFVLQKQQTKVKVERTSISEPCTTRLQKCANFVESEPVHQDEKFLFGPGPAPPARAKPSRKNTPFLLYAFSTKIHECLNKFVSFPMTFTNCTADLCMSGTGPNYSGMFSGTIPRCFPECKDKDLRRRRNCRNM